MQPNTKIFQEVYTNYPYAYPFEFSGVTVVAQRPDMGEMKNSRMVKVAMSFCHKKDKFKKSTGKAHALLKLARGECMQLPIGRIFDDSAVLERILLSMAFSLVKGT